MTNLILTAIVTAYCWTGDPCADGDFPRAGVCAAPHWVPLHTRVMIDGEAFLVTDRMNRRFPDRWDIYMTNRAEALNWGRNACRVELLIAKPK